MSEENKPLSSKCATTKNVAIRQYTKIKGDYKVDRKSDRYKYIAIKLDKRKGCTDQFHNIVVNVKFDNEGRRILKARKSKATGNPFIRFNRDGVLMRTINGVKEAV